MYAIRAGSSKQRDKHDHHERLMNAGGMVMNAGGMVSVSSLLSI